MVQANGQAPIGRDTFQTVTLSLEMPLRGGQKIRGVQNPTLDILAASERLRELTPPSIATTKGSGIVTGRTIDASVPEHIRNADEDLRKRDGHGMLPAEGSITFQNSKAHQHYVAGVYYGTTHKRPALAKAHFEVSVKLLEAIFNTPNPMAYFSSPVVYNTHLLCLVVAHRELGNHEKIAYWTEQMLNYSIGDFLSIKHRAYYKYVAADAYLTCEQKGKQINKQHVIKLLEEGKLLLINPWESGKRLTPEESSQYSLICRTLAEQYEKIALKTLRDKRKPLEDELNQEKAFENNLNEVVIYCQSDDAYGIPIAGYLSNDRFCDNTSRSRRMDLLHFTQSGIHALEEHLEETSILDPDVLQKALENLIVVYGEKHPKTQAMRKTLGQTYEKLAKIGYGNYDTKEHTTLALRYYTQGEHWHNAETLCLTLAKQNERNFYRRNALYAQAAAMAMRSGNYKRAELHLMGPTKALKDNLGIDASSDDLKAITAELPENLQTQFPWTLVKQRIESAPIKR